MGHERCDFPPCTPRAQQRCFRERTHEMEGTTWSERVNQSFWPPPCIHDVHLLYFGLVTYSARILVITSLTFAMVTLTSRKIFYYCSTKANETRHCSKEILYIALRAIEMVINIALAACPAFNITSRNTQESMEEKDGSNPRENCEESNQGIDLPLRHGASTV